MATALVERYREQLPLSPSTPIVTLGEGGTPRPFFAPRLSHRLGLDIWLKWEGANPTGSFKDRGMAVALSKAVEEGAQAVICASTGNTAASAAASPPAPASRRSCCSRKVRSRSASSLRLARMERA